MAHVIRGRRLSRRAFLRGAGAAIALPWLDAMRPALGRTPPAPLRAVFVFAPNGMVVQDWTPRGGAAPSLFEPFLPLRDRVTLLSGLAIDGARDHGDGNGDHARAAASFLTCAHPFKTGGANLRAGVSIDQVLVDALAPTTPFPSLELGMEPGASAGVCDSGYSCAYSNNIAWRTPSTPLAKETDPRALFVRLFGDPDAAQGREQDARDRRRLRSVLDAAIGDLRRLRRDLAPDDRRKLDEYADAVRAVEERLRKLDQERRDTRGPEVPFDVVASRLAEGYAGRLAAMFELVALALATDRTRIATLMLGNGGSNLSYRFLDVPEGHHELSHHGRDPRKIEKLRRIDRFRAEAVAAFLQRLAALDAGSASLLDASAVVFGSAIGDGDRHNHDDLPIVLAGRGSGALRTGRDVAFDTETPLADLYLTLLAAAGVARDRFADSNGTIGALLA